MFMTFYVEFILRNKISFIGRVILENSGLILQQKYFVYIFPILLLF